MLSFNLSSPLDLCREIAARAKALRLAANLSQQGLAERAGVSVASLKRFERTGAASQELVVRVAFALRAEEGFKELFRPQEYASLDEAIQAKFARKRGRSK